MKSNNTRLILISIPVMLSLYLAYSTLKLQRVIELQDTVINLDVQNESKLHRNINDLKNTIQESFSLRRTEIEDLELTEHNSVGRVFDKISSTINTKALFLFISNNTCGSCIEEEMANISQVKENMNPRDIIIVTDFINEREFRAFYSSYNLDVVFVNLKARSDNYALFGGTPVVAIISNQLEVMEYFKPYSQDSFTKTYYKLAVEKYFN